jgi:hypothetical protein
LGDITSFTSTFNHDSGIVLKWNLSMPRSR